MSCWVSVSRDDHLHQLGKVSPLRIERSVSWIQTRQITIFPEAEESDWQDSNLRLLGSEPSDLPTGLQSDCPEVWRPRGLTHTLCTMGEGLLSGSARSC